MPKKKAKGMAMLWLLEQSIMRELRAKHSALAASSINLADMRAKFSASATSAARDNGPASLSVAGDVAQISIEGVLTPEPDFWLWLFGYANTAYSDLQAAIAAAESDPSVSSVLFHVDSPGGSVDGLFETIASVQGMSKPRSVRANLAASAAYGLASVGGQITATGRSATFGSVGVVASYLIDDDVVDITSTEAPDKRPDPSTEAGQATIREYLDAVHQLFAEAIAGGRGTSVSAVNRDFGRGAVVLAEDALKRGMIDAVAAPKTARLSLVQAPSAVGGKGKTMTLQELLTAHPNLCAELEARGAAREHDRACAHLTLGEACGDMSIAITAIKEKTEMTATVNAAYLAAGMNRRDTARAQADADEAGVVADGAAGATTDKSLMEQGLDILAARRGTPVKGASNG